MQGLAGLKVLELRHMVSAAYTTKLMADLGAEVIKIESNSHLDLTRRLPVYPPDSGPGVNRSGIFNQWRQGKKSVLFNLSKPEGVALAKELVSKSDVVDNFATGVMERFGLGYEELRKINPSIIMASISGYGHTGPQRY
jgi:benzylsuccinate CoA-transferase BbsF subunit